MSSPQRQLEQLQELRVRRARPARDITIAQTLDRTRRDLKKAHRHLAELAELWQTLVPPQLAARTALAQHHRGVLTVTVDSSSTSFELDRLLRGGLLSDLRHSFRGTLARVKLQVGELP